MEMSQNFMGSEKTNYYYYYFTIILFLVRIIFLFILVMIMDLLETLRWGTRLGSENHISLILECTFSSSNI